VTEPDLSLPEHSIFYEQYFSFLNEEIHTLYAIAETARLMGFDPTTKVEIPPAHDVAARVEATLEGPVGVAKRIRELQEEYSREEVAFAVAKEIAEGKLGGIEDAEKAADKAVRVALSILTESITAAPLEGIAKVRIRGSGDDQYLALYLAGPIRAAGGTEAAMTVLVADYVRQVLNLPAFKSTVEETERALEEVELYARNVHLQYPVFPELVRFAASRLPIMLTGEPTEEFEVSGSRDLDRIETNRVRGGSVLVLNDGVVGRAVKLAKIVDGIQISGWEWLDELSSRMSKVTSSEEEDSAEKILEPKSDYLADVIGGRPVFSHPSRIGGFRLRYGRSRNTGLAGVGVHPATMYIVEEFLATGTHIRTERPGKGAIVNPVDSVEGPIVLLKDGSVLRVNNTDEARILEGKIDQILYLGDVLVALGEFLENNHPLVPSGYCEEWWSHDLDHAVSKITVPELNKYLSKSGMTPEDVNQFVDLPLKRIPNASQAVHLSKKLKIPLHPFYLYRWMALTPEEALKLREWLLTKHTIKESTMILPFKLEFKSLMEKTGIPHTLSSNKKKIHLSDDSVSILSQLGKPKAKPKGKTTLDLMNSGSSVKLMDKVGFSIGARMGRPEKAEERRMRPPVQVLFPVGRTKGTERRIEKVAESVEHITTLDSFEEDAIGLETPESHGVELEMVSRVCPSCSSETFESRCPECKVHTNVQPWCSHEDCGRPVQA
jgi:DNA polymerase II large subunit